MDSGFLTLLSTALCEFCNAEMLKYSDSLSHPEVFTDAAKSRQLNQNEAATGSNPMTDAADTQNSSNPSINIGNISMTVQFHPSVLYSVCSKCL